MACLVVRLPRRSRKSCSGTAEVDGDSSVLIQILFREPGAESAITAVASERVLATEERRQVELAQVLPDPFSPLELEEDAILEAVEWRMMGDSQRSEKLLSELTRQDLRCIDAHAHLGNLFMEGYWGFPGEAHAQRHYRVGVEIAERTWSTDLTRMFNPALGEIFAIGDGLGKPWIC